MARHTSKRRRKRSAIQRGEISEETLRILQAIEAGELSGREAEQLLGFVRLWEAGGPSPARRTWFRRCAQLAALGLPVPPAPAEAR